MRTPGLRLSGTILSAVHRLSAVPVARTLVQSLASEWLGIAALARLPDAYRGELPDDSRPIRAREPRRWDDARLSLSRRPRSPRSARDYVAAYASGAASPDAVAERAIEAFGTLARRTPAMNVVAASDLAAIRRDAARSTARFAAGDPRPLEGVPFLVKDQHDVAGLPTRFGSRHVPAPAVHDATVVARLRAAGALVLGKSVMTEWGISPLGANIHDKLPKNPHHPAYMAGGSSTGSAVGVALGLCPFAIGADAGGSIRLPAACNGVLGLKPTFGRVSRAGDAFSGSLNHPGFFGVCAGDLAALLEHAATEPDALDPMTSWAPAPPCGGFSASLGDGVRGLRVGVDEHEWRDCDPEIAAVCFDALRALEREGATLVPVRIPLAPHATAIGIATMGCEGVTLARTVEPAHKGGLALDLRLAMNVASGVSAHDYLDVQRLRVGLRHQVASALRLADVLVLPALPHGTPRLPDRELDASVSDAARILEVCRYAMLSTLTGTPAASTPVGFDAQGLPIGLQILGDAWDEAAILAVLAHLERSEITSVRPPPGHLSLFGDPGEEHVG